MVDKTIVEFNKGEADFNIEFKNGKLRFSGSYDGKGVDAGAFFDVSPEYFAEKLKKAIPGKVDDYIIDGLISMLKK